MQLIIHEASIPGLFRLILIVLIVYAIYSLFVRFIIPALLKRHIRNFQQQFTEQNQYARQNQPLKKEGEISITYIDKDKNKSRNPSDAEDIDYEEIK